LRVIGNRTIRVVLMMVAAGAPAACNTLSMAPDKAAAPPSFDYYHDDLADAVLAVELPAGVLLVPGHSMLHVDVDGKAQGSRHIATPMEPADGDAVEGALAPPASGSTDFLLAVQAKDKPAVAAAQGFALGLGQLGTGAGLAVSFDPAFCADGPVDVGEARYSLLIAVPGRPAYAPLLTAQPVASALPPGQGLPACQ
jgi:hypothetical protein